MASQFKNKEAKNKGDLLHKKTVDGGDFLTL